MAYGKSLTMRAIQPPPARVFWPAGAGPYVDPNRKKRKAEAKEKKAARRKFARDNFRGRLFRGRSIAQMLADYRLSQEEHEKMWANIEKELLKQ